MRALTTLQVVTFLEHLIGVDKLRGPFLVVVPLSTVGHWEREFGSWTDLRVCNYHDAGRDNRALIRAFEWCAALYPSRPTITFPLECCCACVFLRRVVEIRGHCRFFFLRPPKVCGREGAAAGERAAQVPGPRHHLRRDHQRRRGAPGLIAVLSFPFASCCLAQSQFLCLNMGGNPYLHPTKSSLSIVSKPTPRGTR